MANKKYFCVKPFFSRAQNKRIEVNQEVNGVDADTVKWLLDHGWIKEEVPNKVAPEAKPKATRTKRKTKAKK